MKAIFFTVLFIGVYSITTAQEIDRPPDSDKSIISTEGENGIGIYSADSFSFYGLDFAPEEITFYGKRSGSTYIADLVTGFNIFFYYDDNAIPSGNPLIPDSGFWELKAIDMEYVTIFEDEEEVNFTIDIFAANGNEHVFFPSEGTFWITAFPTVTGSATGEGRWNWRGSEYGAEAYPVIIDPYNLFGIGITDWIDIEILIQDSFISFAWKMTGVHIDDPFSVEDHEAQLFRVFPNPFKDIVYVESHTNPVEKIEVYDVSGKLIACEHNIERVDLSNIPAGIYFLSIESASEKFVQKIIKN